MTVSTGTGNGRELSMTQPLSPPLPTTVPSLSVNVPQLMIPLPWLPMSALELKASVPWLSKIAAPGEFARLRFAITTMLPGSVWINPPGWKVEATVTICPPLIFVLSGIDRMPLFRTIVTGLLPQRDLITPPPDARASSTASYRALAVQLSAVPLPTLIVPAAAGDAHTNKTVVKRMSSQTVHRT